VMNHISALKEFVENGEAVHTKKTTVFDIFKRCWRVSLIAQKPRCKPFSAVALPNSNKVSSGKQNICL